MDASAAAMIGVNAAVWVWDSGWWPAVVIDSEPTDNRLLVRFEHGVSAPISVANIQFREPRLCGTDKPPKHVAAGFRLTPLLFGQPPYGASLNSTGAIGSRKEL
jgi:hypothetical protein